MVSAEEEENTPNEEHHQQETNQEMASTHIDDDDLEDEEDDDTVVGNCLHCNSPPPSKNSTGGNLSAFTGGSSPCPASNPGAALSVTSASSSAAVGGGRVQVSCDDCRSFICDACHWCHEFQANHEIRVCDRCDAFYCRGCDEMDQCEDCSEVVCNTCSTLMSCKFCGCGLCEDCATACGRCGIVLCARDAKFAVECDTCKMSYCLVCLASGTKDPCVRCGHRPSKRVEQLVHLRLKSIYKAFKQSGASVGSGSGSGGSGGGGAVGPGPPSTGSNSGNATSGGGGGGGGCSHSDAPSRNAAGRDTSTIGGKYSSALRSLTENESLGFRGSDSSKDNFSNFDQSMANEVAAVLQTASNAMASTDGGDLDNSRRTRGKRVSSHPPQASNDYNNAQHGTSSAVSRGQRSGTFSGHSSARNSNSAAERYFRKTQAEMEAAAAAAEAEAEAAAAALLAELDEEKATANSKKSKKKKKKKDKKKGSNADESPPEPAAISKITSSSQNTASAEKIPCKTSSPSQKGKGSKKSSKVSSKSLLPEDEDSTDDEMNFEQLVVRSKGNSRPSKKEKDKEKEKKDEAVIEIASPIAPSKPKTETPPAAEGNTELERELEEFIANEDEEGLESYLANLKGVPGLAVLRKNAKKALKKLREANAALASPGPEKPQPQNTVVHKSPATTEVEAHLVKGVPKSTTAVTTSRATPNTIPAATTTTTASSSSSAAGTPHEPLLRVVSRSQSSVPTTSSRGSGSSSASVPASARAECVMHMSPAVVGWVIGKGGQRIRDMMEESGAKIWIDQESMGPKESRVVYVSGKRSNVDTAVRMVKDLVAKAPVAASAAAAQGVVPVPTVGTTPAPAAVKTPPTVPAVAAQAVVAPNPTLIEAGKDQQSFAAAIASKQTVPVASAPSAPKPTAAIKTPAPAQGWALPDSAGPAPGTKTQYPAQKAKSIESSAVDGAQMAKDRSKAPTSVPGTVDKTPAAKTTELACDPRFIALLIGRQGWTVKNIQSESGASLRIDQSAEPPKIIISGQPENVVKAEKLVRDVLKYPQPQINQEAPRQNNYVSLEGIKTGDLNVIDQGNILSSGMHGSPDFLNNIGGFGGKNDHNANNLRVQTGALLSMPVASNFHRDSLSSTPDLIDGPSLQRQQSNQPNIAQAADTMTFPPGYNTYQQQSNLGLFHESSSATPISSFLQNNQNHNLLPPRQPPASVVDPNIRSHPQEWNQHHGHNHLPPQYPSHTQYPMSQMNAGDHYLRANLHTPAGRRPSHEMPRPLDFGNIPTDQNSHLMQNLEQSRLATIPNQQGPSDGMKDFLASVNTPQSVNNGWGQELKGASIGDSWNQSHLSSSVAIPQNTGFSQHSRPIDNVPTNSNTFGQQAQIANNIGRPKSNPIPDDSQFVDSMFDSLGVPGSDGDGLLSALNSVSLGGAASQQGNNWGSTITGWGSIGQDSDTSSFLQNSRLGGITLNSTNQNNYPNDREQK